MLRKTTSAAVLAAAAVSPTWAQSAAEVTTPEVENATTSNSLSTVTVTVNRRKEKAKDVAGAVSVLGGAKLDDLGVKGVADMAAYVPGLVVTGVGPGAQQLSLRGVSTGVGQVNATVATYIDESPVSFNSNYAAGSSFTVDPNPLDLERVEVLKGPQGSLYGASALGGLVKYVTTEPNLKTATGRFEVGANTVANGGTGSTVRAAVSLPIKQDVLAVRISGYMRDEPGYVDNISSGKNDVNKTKIDGSTFSALLKPNSHFTARLTADTQSITADDVSPVQADALTLIPSNIDLLRTNWQLQQPMSADINRTNLTLNFDLGFANLMSSTSDFKSKNKFTSDLTNPYSFLYPVLPFVGLSGNSVNFVGDYDLKKKTQEFRLTSPGNQTFDWLVGAFYTEEEIVASNKSDLLDGPAGGPTTKVFNALDFNYGAKLKDTSIYANATYKVSEPFDVQLGFRYASIDQVYYQANSTSFDFTNFFTTGAVSSLPFPSDTVSASESHTTWMLSPRWKLDSQTMVYARAATGYRPGGPNFLIPGSTAQKSFDTDNLLNLELGLKGGLPALKLDYAISVFNIDWKNIQAPGIDHSTPNNYSFYSNGGRAHTRGIEMEGRWRTSSSWVLSGNAAFTEAKLDEDISIDGIQAKAGDTVPLVPAFALTLAADYTHEIFDGVDGVFGISVSHVGERNAYFDHTLVGTAPDLTAVGKMPAYDVVDLRAAFSKANWTLSVLLKNAFDQRGVNQINGGFVTGTTGALTPAGLSLIAPRTLGVTLRADF
jgi:outer membrane receptor protein involved in Fe transport